MDGLKTCIALSDSPMALVQTNGIISYGNQAFQEFLELSNPSKIQVFQNFIFAEDQHFLELRVPENGVSFCQTISIRMQRKKQSVETVELKITYDIGSKVFIVCLKPFSGAHS